MFVLSLVCLYFHGKLDRFGPLWTSPTYIGMMIFENGLVFANFG